MPMARIPGQPEPDGKTATSGATYTGTPIRRARAKTLPKPNKKVSPMTMLTIVVTNLLTLAEDPITASRASTRGRTHPR